MVYPNQDTCDFRRVGPSLLEGRIFGDPPIWQVRGHSNDHKAMHSIVEDILAEGRSRAQLTELTDFLSRPCEKGQE